MSSASLGTATEPRSQSSTRSCAAVIGRVWNPLPGLTACSGQWGWTGAAAWQSANGVDSLARGAKGSLVVMLEALKTRSPAMANPTVVDEKDHAVAVTAGMGSFDPSPALSSSR